MSLFEDKPGRRKQFKDKPCYPEQYIPPSRAPRPPRIVPPFSLAALTQKNVKVLPFKNPPIKPYPVGNTLFKKYYFRGDLPISIQFDALGMRILWLKNLKEIDATVFLPIFFEGLCEVEHPFPFFVEHGISDILTFSKSDILSVIPKIAVPLKNALNTRNNAVVATALRVLQILVCTSEPTGEALVPFYRQILPPLNLYKEMFDDRGGEIDYGQRKKENIAELVQETLEVLEMYGGPHAYINIKYIIPTYQSFVKNA